MNISHIALYVEDLEGARDFFEKYFEAKSGPLYENAAGFRSYLLRFEGESGLELMNRPGQENLPKSPVRTGYSHLSFHVGSRERVDELTSKLKAAGFEVLGGPRMTGTGYYESSIRGFEDNLLELTV